MGLMVLQADIMFMLDIILEVETMGMVYISIIQL